MIITAQQSHLLFLAGSGEADGSEARSSAAQSAGGVQERHLPAPGAETAAADRGEPPRDTQTQINNTSSSESSERDRDAMLRSLDCYSIAQMTKLMMDRILNP